MPATRPSPDRGRRRHTSSTRRAYLCALLLACAVLGAVVAGFLGHHLARVSLCGRTTNRYCVLGAGGPGRRGAGRATRRSAPSAALPQGCLPAVPAARRARAAPGSGGLAEGRLRRRQPRKHGSYPAGARGPPTRATCHCAPSGNEARGEEGRDPDHREPAVLDRRGCSSVRVLAGLGVAEDVGEPWPPADMRCPSPP